MWKVSFHPKRAFWRLGLATGTSREFESRDNFQAKLYFLSCSAPVVVTLQLPTCFTHVAFGKLPIASHSRESSWMYTHLNSSLSHTQPVHDSHLNTWYLIAKIQANLSRNKINTWLNKFNLTMFILQSRFQDLGISLQRDPTKTQLWRQLKTFMGSKSLYSTRAECLIKLLRQRCQHQAFTIPNNCTNVRFIFL